MQKNSRLYIVIDGILFIIEVYGIRLSDGRQDRLHSVTSHGRRISVVTDETLPLPGEGFGFSEKDCYFFHFFAIK